MRYRQRRAAETFRGGHLWVYYRPDRLKNTIRAMRMMGNDRGTYWTVLHGRLYDVDMHQYVTWR